MDSCQNDYGAEITWGETTRYCSVAVTQVRALLLIAAARGKFGKVCLHIKT